MACDAGGDVHSSLHRPGAAAILGLLCLAHVAGCKDRDQPLELRPALDATPVASAAIHLPDKLSGVPSDKRDSLGRPIRAACVTCHSLRRPEALPASTSELDEFHVGLRFEHGGLSCASCHVIGDQDTLRKADGTILPMRDAMQLCAQCHGPQLRDYAKGAHGGMSGSYAGGARMRNHCVDCHDPHVPAFQPSTPVLPPRDRFVGDHATGTGEGAHR
ncbi:hypothetical protein [Sorangium sp. So ce406]|uniref:hypothetical protein n=1 Tax=Sorangium sp. So ce406 TaxID=3133311 RepID=UPI003F5B36D3